MEKNADGSYQPTGGFEQLARLTIAPAIWQQMPKHDYLELTPAIDSADMTPVHWQRIAQTILDNYDDYAGFIVLHGTDTMAYTASMLSFLLLGIDKTVILTGSQIPLVEPCSDGANNLLVSLQLIAKSVVPEVCIYFANQLFRGNRATKISTSSMIAFESTNYPVLGAFENQLKLFQRRWLPPSLSRFSPSDLPSLSDGQVAVIYVTPGMPASVMQSAIDGGVKGLVIVSFGSGNVPASNADLMQSLNYASEKGVIVVNVSQCAGGQVDTTYAASLPLQKAGVVSGGDMTIEAAVTKLLYLLARYSGDSEKIRRFLTVDICGEITESTPTL